MSESRPRTPRVAISYDVEVGATTERKQLPFVLGVLADLGGAGQVLELPLRKRAFAEVDGDRMDSLVNWVRPKLRLSVENRLVEDATEKLQIEIWFFNMSDFEPASVARKIEPLKKLMDARAVLNDVEAMLHSNAQIGELIRDAVQNRVGAAEEGNIEFTVERIVTQCFSKDNPRARYCLEELFRYLPADPILEAAPTAAEMIGEHLARIDRLLSAQLNEVFHHPDFQRLEASWRGLEQLVRGTETSPALKIRVLPVSKKELLRDFQRAPEFDQSALFQKVYGDAYAVFGGEPFGALIGDYAFGPHPEDVELLEKISNVAAAARAQFLAGAGAALFSLESFRELSRPRSLEKLFGTVEFTKWTAFRNSEDARFVGLVMPRVLMRLPYGQHTKQADGFAYEEGVDGNDPEKYLWGNAVYAFAGRLTAAFARYGWCASISSSEQGGLVSGLPVHCYLNDRGEVATQCPTEIAIGDRRREELEDLGFIPLCHEIGTSRAVFFSAPSCQKPRIYDKPEYTISAIVASRLEYTFAVSRFAHYINCIVRDKARPFQDPGELARYLDDWLAGYILLDDQAEPEVVARYPLREGRVRVVEVPGKPGRFRVSAYLRPHFQMQLPNGVEEKFGRIPDTVRI